MLATFDINKSTFEITDSGLAYNRIYDRAGNIVNANTQLPFGSISRLCSAQLIEPNQFGNGIGLTDRIYFTGEEFNNGTEWALDTATGDLWAAPALGAAAWENVTELNTGRTDKVALLIGDDRQGAPLLLYVGTKNPNGNFLQRNGLSNGKLFVWVADDPTSATDIIEDDPSEFRGTRNSLAGQFVEIAYYRPTLAGTPGYDALGYATQTTQDALARAVSNFQFSRPEDVSTNPADGTQAVLASTGRAEFAGGADTWGTTYRIDVNFNNIDAAGGITARVDILYDGNDAGAGQFQGPDFGLRSPDNLDWSEDGSIYIQEDRSTTPATLFGGTSGEEASIWKLNPTNGALTRIGQINRSAVPTGQTDSRPTDLGNWESSGVLDVSELFGQPAGNLFVFDVQAHSLTGGPITSGNLVEGGQLSLLSTNRTIIGNARPNRITTFNGNDVVSGGGGNDIVSAGFGDDLIRGGNGADSLSAGGGNDTIIASAGADICIGGLGDDVIRTGLGADLVVIARDSGSDTVRDFNVRAGDKIGLSGGLRFRNLTFSGDDILLRGTSEVLVTLTGVNTTTLGRSSFVIV
ncbi:MAG: DUF839 domain-containing protein [Oculatellaceae cyanobacterium bins.114]|nr:DUF839 domain-containing protein [Oculatellaceae cyanobacterium bins.114]